MGIICVSNQKGGSGKTTAAVNLSAIWGLKKKVLLVDLDPQGNAGQGLGMLQPIKTISDVLEGNCAAEDAIFNTAFKVDVLPSNISLAVTSKTIQVTKLREVLRPLQDIYDVIVIDCPPMLSELTLAALISAECVLIPFKTGIYGLAGLQQLTDTIAAVRREGHNPGLKILGIFHNEANVRTRLFRIIDEQLQRNYASLVLQTVIPASVKYVEASLVGEPINVYDKKAAKVFIELAREVMQKWQIN
jgi:chromosome partitioning protein